MQRDAKLKDKISQFFKTIKLNLHRCLGEKSDDDAAVGFLISPQLFSCSKAARLYDAFKIE